MPQLFKIGCYWVYFWSDEGSPLEPVHVHVSEGRPIANATKIWITMTGKCLKCNNRSSIWKGCYGERYIEIGSSSLSIIVGRGIMNDMKLRLKYEDYHKATNALRLAVQWPPDDDNMYLDATIQRFEFCFELSWRLMRSVLAYEGIDVSTPRCSIREGWKLGLIDDAEKWLDMLEKRMLSAHVYNEITAMDIYQCITTEYVDLLSVFEKRMKERIAFY